MGATQRELRFGRPIWLSPSRGAGERYPSLAGPHETTIAIVGGGMTGALVAHAFASAGISATVLEGAAVGKGSTGASSALLLQEPDLELAQLIERYGARASQRVWELGHESVRGLSALLTRLRVPCDLAPRDTVYYATDAEGARRLRRDLALRAKAGFEADWLSAGELRRTTGISGPGAIRTRGNAQFDPYRACVGVLRSAAALGAQIFERSAVRRIDATRDRVRLHTRDGVLEARRVVIATGYATSGFRPLAGRFRMSRTYVLATEPLDKRQRENVGLSDVMLWNTERPYHYARWTPEHRLLLGGGDRPVRPGPGRQRQFRAASSGLREYFDALLPGLATIDTSAAWEGLFALTADSLPFVGPHRRYPGHLFALGYGGNGLTFGFMAARLLVEHWLHESSRDHQLFAFNRTNRAR